VIDAVIKIGGALLRDPGALATTIPAIDAAAREHTLLIVPGGGPFADAVRAVDQAHALPPSDAHWMAILGMEQYAVMLASRFARAVTVHRRGEIARAHARGTLPVLAPYRWMRDADPLPHSWDVTADSIAAWVAAQIGARCLIIIKAHAAAAGAIVDPYFDRVRPPSLDCVYLTPGLLTGSWFPA
jgi:aspartokinase-like uncharacterized kinase